jgi:hypothetical protein
MRNGYSILVGKSEVNRPLGRSRHRWEDNIETDLREGGEGVYWIHMAEDRDQCRGLVNRKFGFHIKRRIY